MTANELRGYVGREGLVPAGAGLVWYSVRVQDARLSWGAPEVLVRPVAGEGERWVRADRVRWTAYSPAECEAIGAGVEATLEACAKLREGGAS